MEAEQAAGRTKTEIIEAALEKYFEGRQAGQEGDRIIGEAPNVSPETLDSIRDVIRGELREALGPFLAVIQKNGSDTPVIQGRKAASKRPKAPDFGGSGSLAPEKLESAAYLVARVMQIKEAEGLTIREACKKAGTSWPTFSRKRKALEEQEKDREEEDKEEAKT